MFNFVKTYSKNLSSNKKFSRNNQTDAMSLCFAIVWAADSQYLVSFRQFDEKMVDK